MIADLHEHAEEIRSGAVEATNKDTMEDEFLQEVIKVLSKSKDFEPES